MNPFLKPCPFCGAAAKLGSYRIAEDAMETVVACTDCGASIDPIEGSYSNADAAAWAWNRRAAQDKPEDVCQGLDTPERVRFYEHDFYVLSNFSAFSVEWCGHRFPTSEHVYHWLKFIDSNDIQQAIAFAPSAHEAFKLAERYKDLRREDWEQVRVSLMKRILRAKAEQHEYVRRKLLATGERELVEDSWRDDFWGWGPNRDGQNMLGKLWMELRAELRASGVTP